MARGNLITEEQNLKIREMAEQDFTVAEIAKFFGCSAYTVSKRIRDISVRKHGTCRRMTEEEKQGMRKMRKQGYKQQQIADKYNCSVHVVYTHTKDIKIESKKSTIVKALSNGADVDKIAKRNGYCPKYVHAVKVMFEGIKSEDVNTCERRELEVLQQKQLLKEKEMLRAKELEELRLQEIKDFRWGGTVKIC